MRIGGPRIWEDLFELQTIRTLLRRAVELGVNFFDTADVYGPTASEQLIAEILHPYPADLVIATKGGLLRSGRGPFQANGRPEHLRVACEASLHRLRLSSIALYQLHTVDPQVPLEDSVGALKDLQQEGKIQHVGLSNVRLSELHRARAIVPIVSVQNRYSLVDRSSDEVLAACVEHQIAFLPWAPLDRGRLGRRGSPLEQIASNHHVMPAQIALAWLLQRSPVMVPIPGTASTAHIEENVAAASVSLRAEDVGQLDAIEAR